MVDELITQIRTALATRAITKAELARRSGLHRMTLHGCERDDWNPSANTLRALETYLHDINTSANAAGGE